MMKFFRIILFVGIFTNFCHSATISGTVKDSSSGSLLSNAVVVLCSGVRMVAVDSYTTGADGKYTFGNIEVGEYSVVTYVTSYPDEQRYFMVVKATDVITVDINFHKIVPGMHSNKISITVKDSLTGNPLEDVLITIRNDDSKRYYKTDAQGSLDIEIVLPPGENSFTMKLDGYKTKKNYKETVGSEPITLDVVLSTPVYSKMFGIITDSISGSPVSGVDIYVYSQNEYKYRTKTTNDGSYLIDSVVADEYNVMLLNDDSYIRKDIKGVIIGNTPLLKNMVIRKYFYSDVFGKITDSTGRALYGVNVSFYSSYQSGPMITTNADGFYFFNRVKEDPVRNITIFFNICDNYKLDRIDTVFSITSADPVEINIKLPPLWSTKVTGVVKDSLTGHPISNAIVRFREGFKECVYDTTATDGKYEFNFIQVGSPILTLRTMANNYINLEKVMDAACTDIVTDFPMIKASTGTTIEKVNEPINPSLQLLSNGSLKLSNLKDAGELSIIGLNGKIVYRCPIEKGNAVVPLSQQILLSKSMYIVKVQTGKISLQQTLLSLE